MENNETGHPKIRAEITIQLWENGKLECVGPTDLLLFLGMVELAKQTMCARGRREQSLVHLPTMDL